MIRHFFSVLILLFVFLFIFFVTSTYLSKNNREKINSNRTDIYLKIKDNLPNLPLLKNDTNNVIEFNSGYNDEDNKVKRNFWNLFKK
ncbi:hypothetical protein OAL70_03420 [Pelagibacteraceae bacterium]|nr:hypothetical protein [Pelagibacteraceae bacterium]|tara:strand:+ start:36 stop:296 length:261 start_codon:yes stop_codon:yes gene_type:complete